MPKAPEPIPITKPVLGAREREMLLKPLETGWLVQGPYVQAFEASFAGFTGAKHALASTSCTSALHLILAALGIGPDDEVIIPSFTFVATANVVEYMGARPVFADISLDTFNLNPEGIERLITPQTKAIMPVSLFGLCADMPAINELAEKHNLYVIEDAACSLGAYREGRHAGTECTASAFSLHPRKALTTGEGGMVITADEELAALVGKLRNHGAEATDLERHLHEGGSLLPAFNLLGFNYRLTDLQGALGLAQMERAHEVLEGRRQAALNYLELLDTRSLVRPPIEPRGYQHSYQSFVALYSPDGKPTLADLPGLNKERNLLMAAMEADGICVRQGTHSVHTLGYYSQKYNIKPGDFPNSLLADRLSITLPLFAGIRPDQQERVVSYLQTRKAASACVA